jgi:predicted acetyltransferase
MSRSEHKFRLAATHDLARTANLKLRKEASLPEHRLRFLVSHANMLDAITLSLTEIQQCQIECTNYLKAEERLRKS